MIIKHPEKQDLPRLIQLWKEAFGENEEEFFRLFLKTASRDGQFPVSPDKDATLQALRDFEAPFVQRIEQRDPKAIREWIRQNDLFLCGTRALLVGITALGPQGRALTVAKDWSLRDDQGPLDPKWTSGVSYRGIVFVL